MDMVNLLFGVWLAGLLVLFVGLSLVYVILRFHKKDD